jgi:hypothetical protein
MHGDLYAWSSMINFDHRRGGGGGARLAGGGIIGVVAGGW